MVRLVIAYGEHPLEATTGVARRVMELLREKGHEVIEHQFDWRHTNYGIIHRLWKNQITREQAIEELEGIKTSPELAEELAQKHNALCINIHSTLPQSSYFQRLKGYGEKDYFEKNLFWQMLQKKKFKKKIPKKGDADFIIEKLELTRDGRSKGLVLEIGLPVRDNKDNKKALRKRDTTLEPLRQFLRDQNKETEQLELNLVDKYHTEMSRKLSRERKEQIAREIADNIHALAA